MTTGPQVLASWLQAAAALVQAGVAVALFVITKRYVELTARMAASSEAQVELMRAERQLAHAEKDDAQKAAVDRFRQTALSLLERLRQLPGPGADAQQSADRTLRAAVLPDDIEIKDFVALAVAFGPAVAARARAAAENYRWLLKVACEVQSTSPDQGYRYDRLNWKEWVFRYAEAEQTLIKLGTSEV